MKTIKVENVNVTTEMNRYNIGLKEFYYEIHKIVKFHGWKITNQKKCNQN